MTVQSMKFINSKFGAIRAMHISNSKDLQIREIEVDNSVVSLSHILYISGVIGLEISNSSFVHVLNKDEGNYS